MRNPRRPQRSRRRQISDSRSTATRPCQPRRSAASATSIEYGSLEPRNLLATFYVATNGNDSNTGTSLTAPYQTIQQAADQVQPGDTVLIRGGTYREEVNLTTSGTDASPIVFAAYNNENVTVTATDRLTGFTQSADPSDNANVYTATLTGTATSSLLSRHELTVFVNGQLVQEASSVNGADYLNANTWGTFNDSSRTVVRDTALIGSTKNLVGAFLRIRTSDFVLEDRRISAFNSTTGQITLETPLSNDPSGGGRFLIHDAVDLVDSSGEWHFNEETDTFTLWAPGGGDPDNAFVEVKRRAEAFDTHGRDYIHFTGLTFTGGDLDAEGSDGLVLDDIHVIGSDRIFGPEFGTTRTALVFTGQDNIVRNSEFEQIWSAAIRSRGANNQFYNNFIHDIAYNGGGFGGIATTVAATDNLISHNTFTRSGRGAIGGSSVRTVIEHNEFSDIGRVTTDVGAVYFFNQDAGNSVIRYNVFRDISGNLNSGVYVDNFTTNLTVHHNVFYNISAFGGKINLPSSFILYYNNTIFNNGAVDAFAVNGDRNTYGNKFFNNIYTSLDNDFFNNGDPLQIAGNFLSGSSANFLNAGGGDFRLQNTSDAVDAGIEIPGITDGFVGAAPDAGAYELGEDRFEVGHDFSSPPSPVYEFETVLFSNRINNGNFETGLSQWTPSGSPSIFTANASNFRDAALGRFGQRAAKLDPGDGLTQTITGLLPNTNYDLGAWGKLIGEILEGESATTAGNTGGGAGPGNSTHRGEAAVGQLEDGDFVHFAGVDFGSSEALYNQLQISMALTGTGDSLQVRLDSVNGPLIGSAAVPANREVWSPLIDLNLSDITGTRDVYFVFSGSGDIGLFGEARLVNTSVVDTLLFRATDYDGTRSVVSGFGAVEYPSATAKTLFRTGPSSTSATISILNLSASQYDGYVDFVSLTEAPVVAPTVVDLSRNEYLYDVGTRDSPVLAGGWERISPLTNGDINWSGSVSAVDRGTSFGVNDNNRDFVRGNDATTLSHKLANGRWSVTLNMTDVAKDLDNMAVIAEGQLVEFGINRLAGQFSTFGFEIDVLDGELNLTFADFDGIQPEWVLNRLSLVQLSEFEGPTTVDLTQTNYRYDVQPGGRPTFDGTYVELTENANGDIEWIGDVTSADRGAAAGRNELNRDLVFGTDPTTFEHRLSDGFWQVFVTIGDGDFALDGVSLTAEGQIVRTGLTRSANQFINEVFTVAVSDGGLTLELSGEGGANDRWAATLIVLNRLADLPAPPTVVSDIRDDGTSTRPDQLNEIEMTFDRNVIIQQDDLQLVNASGTTASTVDLSGVAFSYNPSTLVATWDFVGATVAIAPGFYQYDLSANVRSSVDNQTVVPNALGSSDRYSNEFYVAIPGDADLSGNVDVLADAALLVQNLGTASGATWSQGDFTGDGAVDVLADAAILIQNLGASVTVPTAAAFATSLVSTPVPVASDSITSASQETRVSRVATRASEDNEELTLAGAYEAIDAAFSVVG